MARGLMGRIRRSFSMNSVNSSRRSSIQDVECTNDNNPINRLLTDKTLQRDFREFLASTLYMPEMIVHVDFISTCGEMRTLSGRPLRVEIERIYHHHIRTFASDKIFFDDLGALKLELEIKLTRSSFDDTFYNKAIDFCLAKLRRAFNLYWEGVN